MARKKKKGEGMLIQGFARVQVWDYGPDGEPNYKLASDTGIVGPNVITNVGYQNFINYVLGGSAGSSIPIAIALGTGAAPATNATSLPSESWTRRPCVYALVASTQARWTASWDSSLCTASGTIGNVAMAGSSGTGSIMCGLSTPAQTWATNQSVNVSYLINFSTV